MENTLSIECTGASFVELDDLRELQGNLKNLDEKDYVKLRNSMTEFGFSFPIFYWQDEEGGKWIIDAHQRVRTLKKMRDEGWTIPPLPADEIKAADKITAKKKLLILQSRYGRITDSGMTDFLNEAGLEIPYDDVEGFLAIPEQLDDFKIGAEDEKKKKETTCPNCGTKFEIN